MAELGAVQVFTQRGKSNIERFLLHPHVYTAAPRVILASPKSSFPCSSILFFSVVSGLSRTVVRSCMLTHRTGLSYLNHPWSSDKNKFHSEAGKQIICFKKLLPLPKTKVQFFEKGLLEDLELSKSKLNNYFLRYILKPNPSAKFFYRSAVYSF